MADLTDSKLPLAGIFLEGQIESTFGRLEPLLTPELLVERHLFGLPLVSKQINPLTNKPFVISTPMLQDYIIGAVSEAEANLGLVIMPTQIVEKRPYHRKDYQSWGYFMLANKPISSLQSISITFASGNQAFTFPNDWIDSANLVWGMVSLIPATFNGLLAPRANGDASANLLYLQFFNTNWVSSLIEFTYVAGFPDGMIPRLFNNYIGTLAAMDILSMLGATNSQNTSSSLSIDGMSQSSSGPGNLIFKPRMDDLKEQKLQLEKKIRKLYRRIVVSAV